MPSREVSGGLFPLGSTRQVAPRIDRAATFPSMVGCTPRTKAFGGSAVAPTGLSIFELLPPPSASPGPGPESCWTPLPGKARAAPECGAQHPPAYPLASGKGNALPLASDWPGMSSPGDDRSVSYPSSPGSAPALRAKPPQASPLPPGRPLLGAGRPNAGPRVPGRGVHTERRSSMEQAFPCLAPRTRRGMDPVAP